MTKNRSLTMKQKIGLILVFAILLSYISAASAVEDTLNLQTQAVILIEQSTGKVLYEKNAHARMFPASTIKILTALVALDNGAPEDIITIGNEVLQVPLDASKAGHVPGDQINYKDLLTALLLPSGNDSAFVIATHVIKKTTGLETIDSIQANAQFALLMNKKAQELGAKESNFINPHGYHDENNYTTAYDMAIITREALKNPIIKEIVATPTAYLNKEGQRTFEWKNRNLLLDPRNADFYYQYATGVKTGFTGEAGECLIASATKDDLGLIAVLYNSPVDMRWGEAKTLLDYGFENYSLHDIVHTGDVVDEVKVEKATKKGVSKIEALANEDVSLILKNTEVSQLEKTVTWNETSFVAPIEAGQIVGKVAYSLEGEILAEVELGAKEAIAKQTAAEFIFSIHAVPYWGGVLGGFAVLMLVLALIKKGKSSKKGFHSR